VCGSQPGRLTPVVRIGYEAEWAKEPAWRRWRIETSSAVQPTAQSLRWLTQALSHQTNSFVRWTVTAASSGDPIYCITFTRSVYVRQSVMVVRLTWSSRHILDTRQN